MSLIGLLEHFKLSSVFQRVEAHEKTGLLIIQQGGAWVEFYFRDGRLMCIGPVRTNATLGDRLLQDGLISHHALQAAMLIIGAQQPTETRIALTLMDLGAVGHEQLRTWAMDKALVVLQALMTWSTGEIHFEEDLAPPPDRLLVALPVSALLASLPVIDPVPSAPPSTTVPPPPPTTAPVSPSMPFPSAPHWQQETPNVPPSTPAPYVTQAPNVSQRTPTSNVSRMITLTNPEQFMASNEDVPATSTPFLLGNELAPGRASGTGKEPASTIPVSSLLGSGPLASDQSLLGNEPVSTFPSLSGSEPIAPNADQFLLENKPAASDAFLLGTGATPADQFLLGNEPVATGFPASETYVPFVAAPRDGSASAFAGLQPPVPVTTPTEPRYVDTSYMRPDMILAPEDLSAFRERNPAVQLTPDQWRLLTKVDGRSSLQTACQELTLSPEVVCQVAGELVADNLIRLMSPIALSATEASPVSQDLMTPGLNNSYVAPGYAATTAQSWAAPLVAPDVVSPFTSARPFETESQWGNGGNGAIFVPGRGWVATPQTMPQGQGGAAGTYTGPYSQPGGNR